MSRGYKNWFQFEQHYNHSVFNFYFFGKKKNSPANGLKLGLNSARWMLACVAAERVTKSPDYTGGFVCLRRRLDECQSWWASTLVTISARYDWFVGQLTPFHYVIGISGILPYNRNVTWQSFELFSVLSHGSIMLPPRQPRVFARLARWQLDYEPELSTSR